VRVCVWYTWETSIYKLLILPNTFIYYLYYTILYSFLYGWWVKGE